MSLRPNRGALRAAAERKYLILLVSLALLVVGYPLVHQAMPARLAYDVAVTIVFVTALAAVFGRMHLRLAGGLLGIPTLLALWSSYAWPGAPRIPLFVAFNAIATLFLALAVGLILNDVLRRKAVSADSIYGAFCAYFLIGLLFGHIFAILETLAPGSFQGSAEAIAPLADLERRRFALTYVSFTTLTNMGYSDLAPRSEAARGLAVAEAISGQFFIAVLIAELIGKRLAAGGGKGGGA